MAELNVNQRVGKEGEREESAGYHQLKIQVPEAVMYSEYK